MNTILLIGMTGTGKSPFIRNYSKDKNLFLFDIQNEWGNRPKYPDLTPDNLSDNWKDNRSRHIECDEKKFIWQCSQKRNTICVFEDATAFMEGKTDKDLRRLLVSKLFTGNVYILVFHCIMAVPPRVMQLSDYVVLFKTNDEDYQVENKFPSIYPYFIKLKSMPITEKLIIKTIN